MNLALLVAVSCTAAAVLANSPSGGAAHPWRELTSDHFVLRTDLSSNAARKLIAQMEFSRAGLVQAVLDGRDERRRRLDVVAFATQPEYQAFASEPDALAFLDHRRGNEVMVIGPLEQRVQAFHVSHEVAHYVLYLRVPLQPRWFSEGMAEFTASGSRPSARSNYVTGIPFPWNVRDVNKSRAPVRELLGWGAHGPYRPNYYPSSWRLVSHLSSKYPKAFRDFESRLANFENPTDAWNAAFPAWSLKAPGRTEVLDEELDAYKGTPDQQPQVLHVIAPGDVSERLLSEAEAITTRLKLQPRWTAGQLESELDRALVLDPTNVAALTMKAERDRASAAELAERAVNAHPDDPGAWVLRARWPGKVGREAMKRSEADFRKAHELAPDDADIALDLASHLLGMGSAQQALPFVLQAERAQPWKPVMFYIGALVRAAAGRCDEADGDAVRYARLMTNDGAERTPEPEELLTEELRSCRSRGGKAAIHHRRTGNP